jgi:hypothetical protein
MDSLIPSYLLIGEVAFPLMVTPAEVTVLASGRDDIFAALRVLAGMMASGDAKDVPFEDLARHGFREQEVYAVPIRASQSVDTLLDGMINWRRLSGSWPDLPSSFEVDTGFTGRALVIPRDVLFQLVAELRALRADVLAGRRQGKVDDTPVPPLRPLTPELEEYERLRSISMADAWEFGKELYARRG